MKYNTYYETNKCVGKLCATYMLFSYACFFSKLLNSRGNLCSLRNNGSVKGYI